MILPGDLFFDFKKIKINSIFHIGTFLFLANLLVFSFYTFPESLNEKKHIKTIKAENSANEYLLQAMFLQTIDPVIKPFYAEDNPRNMNFMRDRVFWQRSQKFPFSGDAILIEKNKKLLYAVQKMYTSSTQYQFGLSHEATTPFAWITYQFTHAGFLHLFSNMLFLLLVTNILIIHVEAAWICFVYILGGIGAGAAYLYLSPNNQIAMVGASGSLCALMAFLSVQQNIKNIKWTYFLSPMQGGYGVMYLPAYLIFPMYLISDFTSTLYHASDADVFAASAVAHSAHIGGAITGLILGLIYLADQRLKAKLLSVLNQNLDDDQNSSQKPNVNSDPSLPEQNRAA